MRYLILLALILMGCDEMENSDNQQRHDQERLSKQSNASVGMPSIVNFQEKRVLKQILEMRDTAITTVTYTQDMNGKLHKICDSVGYGIPYATQYTNPQRISDFGHEVLPQADPNGLFSPASAEGTWVTCYNHAAKKTSVVYIEPRVIVSPFALEVQ